MWLGSIGNLTLPVAEEINYAARINLTVFMPSPMRSFLLGFVKAPIAPALVGGIIWFIARQITQTDTFWIVGMYFLIPLLAVAVTNVVAVMVVTVAVLCKSNWERGGALAGYAILIPAVVYFFYRAQAG